jgi:hypothetical protein
MQESDEIRSEDRKRIDFIKAYYLSGSDKFLLRTI